MYIYVKKIYYDLHLEEMALILHESQMKSFQKDPRTELVWTYNNG